MVRKASVTTCDRVVADLRKQILGGVRVPGEQLPTVSAIAACYDVSENTARRALTTLVSQGLVEVRRGVTGGSFVTIPGDNFIRESWRTNLALLTGSARLPVPELLEIREVLELSAAETAARRRTELDLVELESTLNEPRSAESSAVGFHTNLLRATHNIVYELVAEPVRQVLQRHLDPDLQQAEFWSQLEQDHREILRCIRDQDEQGARKSVRAHLDNLRPVYRAGPDPANLDR